MLTGKRSIIIALASISIVMALLVAAAPARMQVATSNSSLPRFGLVGIARGQVARLNAVMVNPPDPGTPNAPTPQGIQPQGVQPTPFRVSLKFVGANGLPLHDRAGNEIMREVDLLPGEGAWLDLEAGDLLSLFESRRQIRAVVSHVPGANVPPPNPVAPVVVTLEIYNRLSGRTESLYAPVSEPVPDDSMPGQ